MFTTIYHILKKDRLRLRSWLVAWWLVILAKAALFLYGSALRPFDPWPRALNEYGAMMLTQEHLPLSMEGAIGLLWLADFALMLYLVFKLFREDTPLGDRAFWRTRPISGGQLVVAKALFLSFAVFFVPGAIQLGTIHAVGYNWGSSIACLEEFLYSQSGWVFYAMVATVLWRNVFILPFITFGFYIFGFLLALFFRNGFMERIYYYSETSSYMLFLCTCAATVVWAHLYHRRDFGVAVISLSAWVMIACAWYDGSLHLLNWCIWAYVVCLSAGTLGVLSFQFLRQSRVDSTPRVKATPPGF